MSPAGVVDIGTNSTRLLVGDERRATITRLGQGVDRTGRLDEAAVERTLAVLREYAEVVRAHGATRVRVLATSAARDASNREAWGKLQGEIDASYAWHWFGNVGGMPVGLWVRR